MTLVIHGKRIRIHWNPRRLPAAQQNLALAVSSLLAPCALISFTLTFWSMAAEFRWTSRFFVSSGLFSHWQSWLIASVVLLLLSRLLAQTVRETD